MERPDAMKSGWWDEATKTTFRMKTRQSEVVIMVLFLQNYEFEKLWCHLTVSPITSFFS